MQIRIGAYAVIQDEDGRVLLAHWQAGEHSAWTMPGGGIDPGEHPAEAARREVREETGYDVVIGDVIGVDSFVISAEDRLSDADHEPLQAVRIVYRGRITGGELRNEVDGSTDEAAWFPLADVAGLTRVELVDLSLGYADLLPTPTS